MLTIPINLFLDYSQQIDYFAENNFQNWIFSYRQNCIIRNFVPRGTFALP
jgi:hypothetical protein